MNTAATIGWMRWLSANGPLALGSVWLLASITACNTLDAPPDESMEFEGHLVIPVDERPPVQSPEPALAVSGGTLRVTADGRFAIAADPERDTVSVVNLESRALVHTVALDKGSEPGRVVEDARGHVHVALRHAGAIASIDPVAGTLLQQRPVCKAPRGLAYEASSGRLHVACAEGKLVSLDATQGMVSRVIDTEPDLRDVVVRGNELWVTRFKSAELLRFDAQGQRMGAVMPRDGRGSMVRMDNPNQFQQVNVSLQPEVAWKTVPTADGGALVVHQEAMRDSIAIKKRSTQVSSYGGGAFGDACDGIVRTRITSITAQGTLGNSRLIAGHPLAVDVAVSKDGWVAVAHAGITEPGALRPRVEFRDSGNPTPTVPALDDRGGGGVTVYGPAPGTDPGQPQQPVDPCEGALNAIVENPVTAVAFAPDGTLVAQTREPAELWFAHGGAYSQTARITLSDDTRYDTGHELFHRDSGAGIACASCHPEGAEDGHVWQFDGIGARRTQALHVGLRGTAPFHWDGELADVGALMTQIFVGRMGGIRHAPARVNRLGEWLFDLPTPSAMRDADDEAALRGKGLFESAELGCTNCHAGERFTDNRTVSVGTLPGPEGLQVPSLVAIGWRAPFMHDGCARTLAGRFDPSCGGGARHGNTQGLSPEQVADVVAYLETL